MILPLRISLFILGILFAYFFGETLEKFLLEVVRFFVSLETSNALLFNFVHLIILIIPLLLYGVVVLISLSGEESLRLRFFWVIGGMVSGLVSYRIYQVWWIFRGGVGEDISSWSETLTLNQLYFLEKVLPYMMVGIFSALVVGLGEKETEQIGVFSILSSASSFLWLLATHKIQNISGPAQIAGAFGMTCFCGFAIGQAIKKIKEF